MKEHLKIVLNRSAYLESLEGWVNDFLETHDTVNIQMSIMPGGDTQVMIVYREFVEEKKEDD